MRKKYKERKSKGKKTSRTTLLALCLSATAIVAAVFGFLSSGYKSTNLTVSPEGAPEIAMEDSITYEGWNLMAGAWSGDTPTVSAYRGIKINYTVDPEIVEKYESQGYKVEYGIICGIGTDKATEIVYNTTSKLAVKEVDGKLVSATENATAYLAYSSDEEAELSNITKEVEGSPLISMGVYQDFGGNIYISEDGDQSLDTKTYVATAFMRLTDSKGKTQTEYIPAREVLNIAPIELGEFD